MPSMRKGNKDNKSPEFAVPSRSTVKEGDVNINERKVVLPGGNCRLKCRRGRKCAGMEESDRHSMFRELPSANAGDTNSQNSRT